MAENTKKQALATGAELTLEEKINKIKSREITEAEKNMLTLPAFEAACEAVKKVTQETGLIYSNRYAYRGRETERSDYGICRPSCTGGCLCGAVLWCKGCYRHADDHTADQGRAYKGLWCRSGSLR